MKEDFNSSNEVRIKLNITTKTKQHDSLLPSKLIDEEKPVNIGKLDFLDKLIADPTQTYIDVKNIWMCLNYEKRPTVSHVIDYIRKYYSYFGQAKCDMDSVGQLQQPKEQQPVDHIKWQPLTDQIRLYLDDFWLPPYENSRLIRENDCVKVDILRLIGNGAETKINNDLAFKFEKNQKRNLNIYDCLEQVKSVNCTNFNSKLAKKNDKNDLVNNNEKEVAMPLDNFYNSRQTFEKVTAKEAFVPESRDESNKSNKSNKMTSSVSVSSKLAKSTSNNKLNTSKQADKKLINCHKKFAIGGYVHLLNEEVKPPVDTPVVESTTTTVTSAEAKTTVEEVESAKSVETIVNNKHTYFNDSDEVMDESSKNKSKEVAISMSSASSTVSNDLSEEQVIDEFYEAIKARKQIKKLKKSQSEGSALANINQNELNKIASSVNSTGKSKWKNSKSSKQQSESNGPKHIVFSSSSSSESSDSANTSSSSCESQNESKASLDQSTTVDSTQKKPKNKKKTSKSTKKEQQVKPSENVAAKEKENASESDAVTKKSKSRRNRKSRNRRNSSKNVSEVEAESKEAEKVVEEKESTKFYEPSKDEQLNATSNNRTFVIKNSKSLNDFKKIFNHTKLNAPNANVYFYEDGNVSLISDDSYEEQTDIQVKLSVPVTRVDDFSLTDLNSTNMSTSTSADTITSSSSTSSFTETTDNAAQTKENTFNTKRRRHRNRSPKSPKYDFEKLDALKGLPRVNDKLAFQILEISSSFTPEISSYKTGTVVDFDDNTNEISVKLNSRYHSILNKPSKFSVVLDNEDYLDTKELKDEMNSSSENSIQSESSKTENLLKVDWRNLLNIKLLPTVNSIENDDKSIIKSSLPI